MYHREHANLAKGYDPYSNMNRMTLHPFSKTMSSRSRSPTLSYELPYKLQPPPSNIKNKSPTAKHLQFMSMSKITEELAVSSPSHSLLPTPKTNQQTKTQMCCIEDETHDNKQKRICAKNGIQETRHFSDACDININVQLDKMAATACKPKMVNLTSNRSYRKYKTRINTCKQNGERRHHTSESHENIIQIKQMQPQNKHRNTEKKTKQKHSTKDSKTRKKNRAQSTVLYSENAHNHKRNCDHYTQRSETGKFKVLINDDECRYYDDKSKYSQDSYAQKIETKKNKNNRPQTARTQRKKHKTKGANKNKTDDKKHYKSQSHGTYTNHTQYHRSKPKKTTKRSPKTHKTSKCRLNFNEGAMDYMSAEQQLLYLYDYTSAAVMNRSSASTLTINDDEGDSSTPVTPYTVTSASVPSDHERHHISPTTISNCRNGVNSDAITPRSRTCSSPIPTCNILSPPISKYSELSTRAVRYTPHARHKRARTEDAVAVYKYNRYSYIVPEPSLPNLPSPHSDLFGMNPFHMHPRRRSSYSMHSNRNESTMIIHHDASEDDPALLEIPASLTAEEEGACYLEGEDSDNAYAYDEVSFPTSPLMYRLLINDKEWHDVHGIRQQLLRNSKLQCTV